MESKTYVVQELRSSISFDVMRVEVTPTKLHIDPVFVTRSPIKNIFHLE
jgi:hypothetical protein